MITSEQAFDMLPFMVDIYDKLDINNYRKELNESLQGKEVDKMEVGITVMKYILKNSSRVKEEFFNIVAISEGKPVEQVRQQSLLSTINAIKAIFSDKELMGFFKQAIQ